MKWLRLFCLIFLLCCCHSKFENGLNASVTLEVVLLDSTKYRTGFVMRVRVENHTGRDIFFYRPNLQAWSYNGDEPRLFSQEYPIDESIGVMEANVGIDPMDSLRNLSVQLADVLLQRSPEKAGHHNIQNKVFVANTLFLKNGEYQELTKGLTYLQEFSGSWKLVASNLSTIEESNEILGTPPDEFKGYQFYKDRIVSDTLRLVIR